MKYITESIKKYKKPFTLFTVNSYIFLFLFNLEARKDNETIRINENEVKLIEEKSRRKKINNKE